MVRPILESSYESLGSPRLKQIQEFEEWIWTKINQFMRDSDIFYIRKLLKRYLNDENSNKSIFSKLTKNQLILYELADDIKIWLK